jgi:hypothetical protein
MKPTFIENIGTFSEKCWKKSPEKCWKKLPEKC